MIFVLSPTTAYGQGLSCEVTSVRLNRTYTHIKRGVFPGLESTLILAVVTQVEIFTGARFKTGKGV